MKYFFCVISCWLISFASRAQTPLAGRVVAESGEPVPGAIILMLQKKQELKTVSDEQGYFQLTISARSNCRLQVSAMGFETWSGIVVASTEQDSMLIRLTSIPKELQAIEVVGRTSRKYSSDYSFSATKFAVPNREIPQAVSSITKELIADRNAFQLSDAAKMASGVIPSSYYNQFSIRGISQNEEGQIVNGMRTRQYYFLQPLTANIDRVEVVKGPASATFSSVDPGGSINIVTKKPLPVARREISLSAGSFSTIRGALDFTGPLSKDRKLLYRLNGAYQEAKSYRDLVGNKSFLLSPSFSWVPDARTSLNTELIISSMNGNLDRGQPIFGAVAGATDLKSTPISLNLAGADDHFISKELILMGNFSHKFSDRIALNLSYMKQTWKEDLQEHRTTNAFGPDINNNPVSSLAAMQFVQRRQTWNTDNLNSYISFRFSTGPITHTLLFGYDLHRWQKLKGGGQNAARGFMLKNGQVAAAFDPVRASEYQTVAYGNLTLPKPNVPHFDLNRSDYFIRNSSDYVFNNRTALPAALTTTQAVYVQEMLQWKPFTLLLSLRKEWFEDITNYKSPNTIKASNTALLPRVGLTWSATRDLNFYASFMKGFQPQSNTVTLMPNTGSLKPGARFEPLLSELKEFGTKAQLFDNTISVSAAVYEIGQQNILINANIPAYPDSLITRGEERSRGFEIEVAGFVLPGWQVNASYSYIDARIIKEKDAALEGARKQNTPFHSGNLWTRYNFSGNSLFKDLGIGLGLQYSGNKVPWFTRAFTVPAYTLLDMALYYQPAKSNIQLALNVNNLLNETWWLGAQSYLRLFPGSPRSLMFTATYKF
ncbi:TonB-dependent receptor [Pseudoflavitalea sp. G-6-1-2]|uniref:TonB-dependent siderophore receptor n=1 Tax=Pseudoflavitalea sp. G-6-1-2 TaxID=2728841 RepID=UPI00146D7803|nr:TonB-dependent siderophore receptor [Pseudoflavitalea sp. G-6-1-2]NML22182.1 TonB-dependent receptor [Pseudoflavitalea sp. G-6-1-2]